MPSNKKFASVVEPLSKLLADSYLLAFKTHGYHWNVVGPQFKQLHDLFSEQYTALYEAADEVAERIRALDAPAPASPAAYAKLATVTVADDAHLTAAQMIAALRDAHLATAASAYAVIAAAEAVDDAASADLATTRAAEHEKQAWMLSSLLA